MGDTFRLFGTGEDKEANHGEDVHVKDKEDQNVEDLGEGQFDGFGQLLHDAGRDEEDDWSEEPTDSQSVAKTWMLLVYVTWTIPEGDEHVGETHHNHGKIEK